MSIAAVTLQVLLFNLQQPTLIREHPAQQRRLQLAQWQRSTRQCHPTQFQVVDLTEEEICRSSPKGTTNIDNADKSSTLATVFQKALNPGNKKKQSII